MKRPASDATKTSPSLERTLVFFKCSMHHLHGVSYIISFIAAALLVIGLAGNGFEMRKARLSTTRDEDMVTKNMFANKRNFKWFAFIAAALVLLAIGNAYT